jgi:hypothetical protein
VRSSVVGQSHAGNRAPRRERTEIDKSQRAHWKARKRTGDTSPKRVNELIETGNAGDGSQGAGPGTVNIPSTLVESQARPVHHIDRFVLIEQLDRRFARS